MVFNLNPRQILLLRHVRYYIYFFMIMIMIMIIIIIVFMMHNIFKIFGIPASRCALHVCSHTRYDSPQSSLVTLLLLCKCCIIIHRYVIQYYR